MPEPREFTAVLMIPVRIKAASVHQAIRIGHTAALGVASGMTHKLNLEVPCERDPKEFPTCRMKVRDLPRKKETRK